MILHRRKPQINEQCWGWVFFNILKSDFSNCLPYYVLHPFIPISSFIFWRALVWKQCVFSLQQFNITEGQKLHVMLWRQQQCFCPFVLRLKDGYSTGRAPFAAAKVVGELKTKDLTWENAFTRESLVKVLLNDVELMLSTNYTPNNIIKQQEQNVFSGESSILE